MSILMKLQEIISFPIVVTMLGIGLYMGLLQSKSLDTVSHLEREAKFTKIVGYVYIVLALVGAVILLL